MTGVVTLDLRQERRQIDARLRRLGQPQGVSLVLQRTINRVLPSVRSAAAKAVAAEISAPQKFTRAAQRLRRASRRQLSGALQGDLKRIPLIAFAARPTREGVIYQIGKQGRQTLAHAYIQIGNSSGQRNVFLRARADAAFTATGQLLSAGESSGLVGRYPTLIKYGPSVARVLLLDRVQRIMSTTARARWDREIEAQLRYYLEKQGFSVDG